MRIPIGDNTIGYVSLSEYISNHKGIKVRGAYFHTNNYYETEPKYTRMTFKEFKEKYPIPNERYIYLRYIERPYN